MTVENITGERLLKVAEVSRITGIAVGTLNRGRIFGGDFPAFCRRGKSVFYKYSTVLKFMTDQAEYKTTSEVDAKKERAAA
jgi:hypothetical protein